MPLFEIKLISSATVEMKKDIEAPTLEDAKEIFKNRLESHYNNYEVQIIEPPKLGHDFEENDIDCDVGVIGG